MYVRWRSPLASFVFVSGLTLAQIGCQANVSDGISSISRKPSPTPVASKTPQQPPNQQADQESKPTELALENSAADGFLNAAEINLNEELIKPVVSPTESSSYALVSAEEECNAEKSYQAEVPRAKSLGNADNTQHKVCVMVKTLENGATTFKSSAKVLVDVTPPEFAFVLKTGAGSLIPLLGAGQTAEFVAIAADGGSGLKPLDVKPSDVEFIGSSQGCVADVIGNGVSERTIAVSKCTAKREEFAIAIRAGALADKAGNTNSGKSVSPRLGVFSELPLLEVTNPVENLRTKEQVEVSGACQASAKVTGQPDKIQIFVDGTAMGPEFDCRTDGSFNTTVNLGGNDGEKMLRVVATEGVNKTPVTRRVIKDNAAPVLTFKSRSAANVNSAKTAIFTFNVADNPVVAGTTRKYNITTSKFRLEPASTTQTEPINCAVSFTPAADQNGLLVLAVDEFKINLSGCTGNGGIKIVADAGAISDEAGNVSGAFANASASVVVDNSGPSTTALSITAPQANTEFDHLKISSIPIEGTCEKGGKAVTLVGATGSASCGADGKFKINSWSFPTTLKKAGPVNLSVSQADGLGNVGTSSSVSFTIKPLFINNIPQTPNLSQLVVGGCQPVSGSSFSATATGSAKVRSVNCITATGELRVVLHLKSSSADENFALTVTQKDSAQKVLASVGPIEFTRKAFACPEGYVGVPASGIAGLGNISAAVQTSSFTPSPSLNVSKDFCVMKFTAKKVDNKAVSVAAGTPWVDIIRGVNENDNSLTALKACNAIDNGTGKFRLISNTQWQTIARNIENEASNWSSNAVASGRLARGHSDKRPSGSLAGSADTDPYFGTGNSSTAEWNTLGATPSAGTEQRRTHKLTNGEVVWDFAGNVWQWVSDNATDVGVSPALPGTGSTEFSNTANFPRSGTGANLNLLRFGPQSNVSSDQNAGTMLLGPSSSVFAIARGGSYTRGTEAGIYATQFLSNTGTSSPEVGFRCVFMPFVK